MDCENCRHLTIVGLHDTGPRSEVANVSVKAKCAACPDIRTLMPRRHVKMVQSSRIVEMVKSSRTVKIDQVGLQKWFNRIGQLKYVDQVDC